MVVPRNPNGNSVDSRAETVFTPDMTNHTCTATCSANGRRCEAPANHAGLHDFIGIPHPTDEARLNTVVCDCTDAPVCRCFG